MWIFGWIILVLVWIVLLAWNEKRTIKMKKALVEWQSLVVNVEADEVLEENDWKLVHMIGDMTSDELLNDEDFALSWVSAIKLIRVVEMYQREEEAITETDSSTDESKTTYEYKKVRSDSLIDSSGFVKENHDNPVIMPFDQEVFLVNEAKVWAFTLSQNLLGKVNFTEEYGLSDEIADALSGSYEVAPKHINDMLYFGFGSWTASAPKVWDIKVSFRFIEPQKISLIAQQEDDSFVTFVSSNGTTLEMLDQGSHSSEEMFTQAIKNNRMMMRGLRLLGILLIYFWFYSILYPIKVLADIIPLVGNIVWVWFSIISGFLALWIGFIVIGISRIAVRPLIWIILLALWVWAFFGLRMLKKRNDSKSNSQSGWINWWSIDKQTPEIIEA